jgi:hypothetical protein
MIALGYPGEVTNDLTTALVWGTLSSIPFAYILYVLWGELSKTPERLEAPQWHRELLLQRLNQVQQGTASFQSWDTAISELRSELQ